MTCVCYFLSVVARAVCSINECVGGGDAEATLVSLKASLVGIRSITDECAATYQEKLSEARQRKAESGKNEGSYYSTCVYV